MGLIKEPRNVDFYVIDKPWSDDELKEFSEIIKQYKTQHQKKKLKALKIKPKVQKTKV
jgi:hypothetical protein